MVKKYESKKQENLEDLLSEESLNDLQGKIDVAKKIIQKKFLKENSLVEMLM